ncbi:MAG: hypothetical protein JWN39_3107, partial [Ilumatobacteraceae bacterium]|nr:hypothetical protein [Ilumatobacteraceae bacterium]
MRRSALTLVLLASALAVAPLQSVPAAGADASGPVQPKVVGNQLVDARNGKIWV